VPSHSVGARVRERMLLDWGRDARRRLHTSGSVKTHASALERAALEAVVTIQQVRRLDDPQAVGRSVARYLGGEPVDLDSIVIPLLVLGRDGDSSAQRALLALARAVAAWGQLSAERARDLAEWLGREHIEFDELLVSDLTFTGPLAAARVLGACPPTAVRVRATAPPNGPNRGASAHPPVMSGGACARSCLRSRH
jgi:hypothetical protein